MVVADAIMGSRIINLVVIAASAAAGATQSCAVLGGNCLLGVDMKVYYYTPEDLGLEEFPQGHMRLGGFECTENPANADVFCLPPSAHAFDSEQLLGLKYLSGREERHVLWNCCEDMRIWKVPWIHIHCACTKAMLETPQQMIAWPWPVEPLGDHPYVKDDLIMAAAGFKYDVSFWGWRTGLDLTKKACDSVQKTRLRSLLHPNKTFFGYIGEDDPEYMALRYGFITSLWRSRLALVPASLDGVVRYRLYEQMSMGRGLPVHICDNAVMPWASKIRWDVCTITIPEAEVDNTGDLLVEWLADRDDSDIHRRARYAQDMFNRWLHRDKWIELFGIAVRERLEGKL